MSHMTSQDIRAEDDIANVRIIPTYVCSGPTTCVSISRSKYKDLVGRYIVSEGEGITIAPDDEILESSPFAALVPEKFASKKKPVEASRLSEPKGLKFSKVSSDGAKGAPRKIGAKSDAAPARLRGHLGNTGPQVSFECWNVSVTFRHHFVVSLALKLRRPSL